MVQILMITKPNFCLKEARIAYDWVGDEYIKMVEDNPKSIIEGEMSNMILSMIKN